MIYFLGDMYSYFIFDILDVSFLNRMWCKDAHCVLYTIKTSIIVIDDRIVSHNILRLKPGVLADVRARRSPPINGGGRIGPRIMSRCDGFRIEVRSGLSLLGGGGGRIGPKFLRY